MKVAAQLEVPGGAAGVVFAFTGRITGMDIFDQSATLERLWRKVVRSYAIDAMEEPEESVCVSREHVRAWLKASLTADSEKFRSPGLGEDIRFEGERMVGASLVLDDQPVHTEIWAT